MNGSARTIGRNALHQPTCTPCQFGCGPFGSQRLYGDEFVLWFGCKTGESLWVKMYLGDRDETHEVSVTVTNSGGDVIFEKAYRLSDSNEADEEATFPASTEPESVAVIVDGTRFQRDWPGFAQLDLPCEAPNEAGIEIYI